MTLPRLHQERPTSDTALYRTDFYAWTQEQASLLRRQQWHSIDRLNLIEEIESLGKQQRQELRNRLSLSNWTFTKMGIPAPLPQS